MTSFFGDDVLIRILQHFKDSPSLKSLSLVNRRWLRLLGLLKTNIKLLEWSFLESGRLVQRFPNLSEVDLSPSWTGSRTDSKGNPNFSSVMMSHNNVTIRLRAESNNPFDLDRSIDEQWPTPISFDRGLYKLVRGCSKLRSVCVVDVQRLGSTRSFDFGGEDMGADFGGKNGIYGRNGTMSAPATPLGLVGRVQNGNLELLKPRRSNLQGLDILAKYSPHLQELEVRQCTDSTALSIAEFSHLQVLRLVGVSTGFYYGQFTDSGLTHLSIHSKRIMVLSLNGCDVGYSGLAAIGQNCPMLSSLVLGGKGLRNGWLKSLQFYQSLQTLRLEGLKHMDKDPGNISELVSCPCLDQLELVLCDVRPHFGFLALLSVCSGIRHLGVKDCWGLDDEQFMYVANCKLLQSLSLEGCSMLTALSLESVVVSSKDLRRLFVTYCDAVREADVSTALQDHMFNLKELKWQPDTQKVRLREPDRKSVV